MNREQVIRMAREAEIIDFRDASDDPHVAQMVEFLQRFAAMVAAAEREACAKACEDRRGTVSMFGTSKECAAYNIAVHDCAAAIRARGVQPKD